MAHGNFIWFELMSPDPVASATFYSAVFGWDIREQGHNDEHGETYRFLYAGEAGVGGLMLQPEPMRFSMSVTEETPGKARSFSSSAE